MVLLVLFAFLLAASTCAFGFPELKEDDDSTPPMSLCTKQMSELSEALKNKDQWALAMLDASSKIPSGMLYGNVIDFGNFDQCVAIDHQTDDLVIEGKHCALALVIPFGPDVLKPTKQDHGMLDGNNASIQERAFGVTEAGLYLSLCVPSACEPEEFVDYFNDTLGIEDLPEHVVNKEMCQLQKDVVLNAGDIAVTIFLAVILMVIVGSTGYDLHLKRRQEKPTRPILLSFSVYTNAKKLFTVQRNDSQINCLHGIRSISMMWVVLGHRFAANSQMPAINFVDIAGWPGQLYTQYIQAAHLAVDTFFFLSGMMISFGYWKTVGKPKKLSFVPLLYLHRFLRITPALLVLFLFSVTIFRHIGSGPLWASVGTYTREPCLEWWWSFFLYVQNYVNHVETDMCLIHTWYLSADMQLFLMSPLLLLPLGYITVTRNKKVVYLLCGVVLTGFTLVPMIINFFVQSTNIFATHDRLAVWMVGFICGIVLEEIKTKKLIVKLSPLVNICTWTAVLVGMLAIILTMHDVRHNPTDLKTNMFDTFHKPAWGIALAWIVYSCTIGQGGIVNSFLSHSSFQVLSRLTYCMYLVHFLAIFFSVGQIRMPEYFTEYNVFYAWCGDMVVTILLALVWVLAFESPMIAVEKLLFAALDRTGAKTRLDATQEKPTVATVEKL